MSIISVIKIAGLYRMSTSYYLDRHAMRITSQNGLYVSPVLATMNTSTSATYHLDASSNTITTGQTLLYDEIFDISFNAGDSVTFLSSFLTAGFSVSGATVPYLVSFSYTQSQLLLLNILMNSRIFFPAPINPAGPSNGRFTMVGQTPQSYLLAQLNAWINGQLTIDGNTYLYTATFNSISGEKVSDFSVHIDENSGTVVLDYEGASESVARNCFTSEIVQEIPATTFGAYTTQGSDTIDISGLPIVAGDQIVFGVKTIPGQINMTPTGIQYPVNGIYRTGVTGVPLTGNVGANFLANHQLDLVPSQILAFRITFGSDLPQGVPFIFR